MTLTLTQFEARLATFLMDEAGAVWPTAALDESLRQSLEEYSQANPLSLERVLTTPAAGREIALNGLGGIGGIGGMDGLRQVTDVWWPYDSDAAAQGWPPNRPRGWRLWWDDAQPVLILDALEGKEPQAGDEVRVWYTAGQRIQGLDGADSTTVSAEHQSLVVLGAAAYACWSRSVDQTETAATAAVSTPNYAALALRFLKLFRARLQEIRMGQGQVRGTPFGAGWRLDRWDAGAL
jgi:hypothetical protein